MKKIYCCILLVLIFLTNQSSQAQVAVTASAGTLSGTYATLKAAFDAVNLGIHQGDITIGITGAVVEGATPATLNSGDADPCNYTSVTIFPEADGASISGNPASGFGVIQLNGADNVIIDGDNPNTPGTNRNLTINNTALASVAAGAVIRIATNAGTAASADNIFIVNSIINGNVTGGNAAGITSITSSASISYGIYCGGKAGLLPGGLPTAIIDETDKAPALTTIDNLIIDNNQINQCGKAIVFNGTNSNTTSSLTISTNLIGATAVLGAYPYTIPTTTVYTKGIWIAGADGISVSNNTIQNVFSYVSNVISAVELVSSIGTGSIDISGNTISGIANNGTSSSATAILVSAVSNKFFITSNVITNIRNRNTGPVAGIQIASAGGQADISKNKISGILNGNTSGYAAFGIHLATSANAAVISNNFIDNVMNIGAGSFSPIYNASGIYLASGANHQIYHNSVHLSGVSAATTTNLITCLSVFDFNVTGLDIRNNIFSNTVTGGAASNAHVCLYFPFPASAALGYNINNNAYFTGATAGLSGVAYAGSTSYLAANLYAAGAFNPFSTLGGGNFRSYSAAAGFPAADFASFASIAAAPFVSATDLHITPGVTRLESGGVPVATADDIDNTVRSVTFPDMGADEFAGTIQDLTAPLITFTPLAGTCVLGNRTLTATIADPSGVGTGAGLPRLYWRIGVGAWTLAPAPTVAGNDYTFTFGAGAIVGNTVSYYIVAQDAVGTPNVISNSYIGGGGYTANPPAAAVVPTTVDTYNVQAALAPGTYTVGVAQTYTTLTAAVTAYNNSCLSGAIVFNLTDANYPSETYPIVIGNPEASSTNTLTIKPNTSATIAGNSAITLIKLNGADYVTIDGSNSGGADQNLTLINNDASTSAAVIWIGSAGAANGATNNTIKNLICSGSGSSTTVFGIVSSSGITQGGVAEAANASNRFQNNSVSASQYGIALVGPSGGEGGNVVTENKLGAALLANKLGFRGLFISNQTGVSVSRNNIEGIASNASSNTNAPAGITVRGAISGGNIFRNVISDVENTNTAAWAAHGITLQASTPTSNLTVYNNFIFDIIGDGYTPNLTDNGHGIGILGGGGYNIYYNSINLNTDQPTTGNSAAIFIDNRVGAGGTPVNLNIRNNIFSNQQTAASGTRYAIYSAAPAASFTTIDYNDYYSTGITLGFLGSVRNNITAWQTATGQDLNSVAVNPVFIAPNNLHLQNTLPSSPLNALATNGTGIAFDIDGNVRAATPDIGADEFTPDACVANTGGLAVVSLASLCVSGNVTLSASGYATGLGIAYQWQSSTDNFATVINDILGATNPAVANPPLITGNISFRLRVICAAGLPGFSNIVNVAVSNPSITGTTPNSRCGLGTVILGATGSAGTQVNWYAAPTGGSPLPGGTNTTTFTTPSISANTTFYAQALTSATPGTVGPLSPTTHGGTINLADFQRNLYFDVAEPTTLLSIDVYPQTSGENLSIQLFNAANVQLGVTLNFLTNVSGGITPQTLLLNFSVPIGSGYYLTSNVMPASGLIRNTSGSSYPYTSPVISITGSDLNPYYTYYYNWQYASSCGSSPRTSVLATVTVPPVLTTLSATPAIVCGGGPVTLAANTTPIGTYTSYTWTPGGATGTSIVVNPVASTTYTVIASNATCATSGQVAITVNPQPNPVTVAVTPSATVCAGSIATLTATGGNGTFFSEDFNLFPVTKFALSGVGVSAAQNTTYYQAPGTSSVLLTYASNADGSYETTNDVNLSFFNNPTLTFSHICGTERTYDYGFVQYSTDGGLTYTSFPTASYTGAGTLKNGVVSFDRSSYPDWDAVFTSSVATPGAGPATGLWKTETINLTSWQASTQFRIRFRLDVDPSVVYYGWLIDNVAINGQAPITWLPVTDLYTNLGGTIPYVGGSNAAVVYTKPVANRTYNASAKVGTCTATSANVDIVYTSQPIAITIAASTGTTICKFDTVKFSIASQDIQGSLNPFYDWRVNGVTLTGSATNATSVGTTVTVASTANLYVGMRVSQVGGPGSFAPNTTITSILSATQFTVSALPISPLSAQNINAIASGKTVTFIDIWSLVTGDAVTCVLTVGGLSCPVPISGVVTSNSIGTFTVNPNTPASVSIAALPAGAICAGTSVTFTATPTNGGAAPTYEWFVNGVSQGPASALNTFTSAALTNGQMVTARMVSNALTCPFPVAPVSTGITMVVNPAFPVSVVLTASPGTSVCPATMVTFTANPTNGGITPLYEFFVNSVSQGLPSGVATFSSALLSNLDVVEVQLTSSIASCATGNPAMSPALTINIAALPVSVTLTPNTPVCAGIAKTFTANPVNEGGAPLYEFFVNSVSQGAPSATATLNYIPVNGDLVEVQLQSSLGACAVPNPATGSLVQTVDPNPTATISSSSTIVCSGTPVVFTALATAGGLATISNYQWVESAPIVNVGANSDTYFSASIGKSYKVTVTNSAGCTVTSNVIGPLSDAAVTPLNGVFTIGDATATASGASVGTTINVGSTAGLVPGQAVSVTTGTGGFATGVFRATVATATVNITVASTTGIVVGQTVMVASGTGAFANGTTVASIVNATQFTVSVAPTVAIAVGANIIAVSTVASVTNATQFIVVPAPVTALAAGATISGASCSNYISFATAIRDLNLRTINANCTFNVPANYVEDVYAQLALGNTALNASMAARTVTFQKVGVGANPLIRTAYAGTALSNGLTIDGIWSLNGIDNVTVDGISLLDNNTLSPTTMMEFGYGLFKLSTTDGAQNNTIRNCSITLNKANNNATGAVMTEGSAGIVVLNSLVGTPNALLTPTVAAGSNSNNKFYSNSILNCNVGIALRGYNAPNPYTLGDFGNDIGGSIAVEGNSITDLGSGGIIQTTGIRAAYQWGVNISNNFITSNAHNGIVRGIWGDAAIAANAVINNNNVNLSSAATTAAVTGIENLLGTTGALNTVAITNNTVTATYTTATTGVFTGITNGATAGTVNINGNTIQNAAHSGTGTFTGIGNTGAILGILNLNNNTISGNTKTGAGIINLLSTGSPGTTAITTINGNTINNNTVVGGAAATTLSCITQGGTSTYTVNGNSVFNNSITGMTGAAAGTISGYTNGGGTQNETVTNNSIYNLFITGVSTGSHTVRGINHATTNASPRTVSGNVIHDLYSDASSSAIISGILSGQGQTVNISRNYIYNLFPGQSSTLSAARGIAITSGTTVNVTNNVVAIDLTLATPPAANAVLTGSDAVRGIEIGGGTNLNVFYNSVNLVGAGSGTGFGSSAISQTNTITILDLRNNIFNNTVIAGGAAPGFTVAYRRATAVGPSYAVASNYNSFYAGVPSASNLLYYVPGGAAYQTIGTYRGGVAGGREAASNAEKTYFTSSINLIPTVGENCINKGAGNNTGTGVITDYINTARAPLPITDIGAYEFTSVNSTTLIVTPPAGVCFGNTVNLTVPAVTVGSSVGANFQYFTDIAGTIPLVAPPANAINVTGTYYIRAYLGTCSTAPLGVPVTISPNNNWIGVDNDWNNPNNWCPAVVPTATSDLTIPAGAPNYPIILTGGSGIVRNLTIAAGGTLSTVGTGYFEIKGNLLNSGTIFNRGEIRLTGAVAQTFPGATGTISAMNSLTINNASGANPAVTINKDLTIGDVITPTAGVINLDNVFITLRSKIDSTARVGVVGGTASFVYTGTGNFVVERYYPSRRTWRLITAPVVTPLTGANTKTIFSSWQASGNVNVPGNATWITGLGANPAANGLDISPLSNYSLKTFNYVNSQFDRNIINTRLTRVSGMPVGNTANLSDTMGYFMFVRGDRSPANVNKYNTLGSVTVTTLRDTGNIKTGTFTYNCNPGIGVNFYTLIGNPYASPVDFGTLTRNNLNNKFWAWDPNLATTGAYVTLDFASGYVPVKVPLTAVGTVQQTRFIQSSQAILVEANGATPSLIFKESDKSANNNQAIFRPTGVQPFTLAANLFIKEEGLDKLTDGVVSQFGTEFDNKIDHLDAVKFANVNETFSIASQGTYLSLERRRELSGNDTLFYFFNRSRQRAYRFNVYMQHFDQPGLAAYLEDAYLKTSTPVNMEGDTWIDFSVTSDAASANKNRFRIVFKKLVQTSRITAEVVNNDVAVDWKVNSDIRINEFDIERSSDGSRFEKVGTQLCGVSSIDHELAYSWLDKQPAAGDYFYRVKIYGSNGSFAYTDMVKVRLAKRSENIYVYPNPVINNSIGLYMSNMPSGLYNLVLMSENGSVLEKTTVNHAGGKALETVKIKAPMLGGSYQLEVTGPDKKRTILKVIAVGN